MSVVTIKDKFQIEIPPGIRKKAKVEVGDLLEARIENGKITLTPKRKSMRV